MKTNGDVTTKVSTKDKSSELEGVFDRIFSQKEDVEGKTEHLIIAEKDIVISQDLDNHDMVSRRFTSGRSRLVYKSKGLCI